MNLGKILQILNDKNIDKNQVFQLVESVKRLDLSDEDNLRIIIRQAASIANKNIPVNVEDMIIQRIKTEGISASLLEFL